MTAQKLEAHYPAFRVLEVLKEHADADGVVAGLTSKVIAEEAGVSHRTTMRKLAELVDTGVVTVAYPVNPERPHLAERFRTPTYTLVGD